MLVDSWLLCSVLQPRASGGADLSINSWAISSMNLAHCSKHERVVELSCYLVQSLYQSCCGEHGLASSDVVLGQVS
jgi:hypothetical protein